jgi:bisphosphoglycerate-dependent phosphoglycerate mutase
LAQVAGLSLFSESVLIVAYPGRYDIPSLEIPMATPLVYEFNDKLEPISSRYLEI